MKILITLLMSASALMALDDPTYPIHENGEYLCFLKNENGGQPSSCQLWLFGRQVNENLVEAYRIKRYGRYLGGGVATSGGPQNPVGDYEKEPVILNLNNFAYLRLLRIKKPQAGESTIGKWTEDPCWDKFRRDIPKEAK